MADVTVPCQIVLKLTPDEFRLISKALGGRLREDEVENAKQLGDDLMLKKAKYTKHIAVLLMS